MEEYKLPLKCSFLGSFFFAFLKKPLDSFMVRMNSRSGQIMSVEEVDIKFIGSVAHVFSLQQKVVG